MFDILHYIIRKKKRRECLRNRRSKSISPKIIFLQSVQKLMVTFSLRFILEMFTVLVSRFVRSNILFTLTELFFYCNIALNQCLFILISRKCIIDYSFLICTLFLQYHSVNSIQIPYGFFFNYESATITLRKTSVVMCELFFPSQPYTLHRSFPPFKQKN